jgi:DnaJ-domain-containing protein 1
MAPRFSRRRRKHEEGDGPASTEESRLDSEEHAWWAKRDINEVWTPREEPSPPSEGDTDVLAEHFGDEWRISFDYTPPPAPPVPEEPAVVEPPDPYEVFGVEPSAPWEDIIKARRRVVRRHHPDRLAGLADDERAAAEDRIREINAAYAELRVRRGKK